MKLFLFINVKIFDGFGWLLFVGEVCVVGNCIDVVVEIMGEFDVVG